MVRNLLLLAGLAYVATRVFAHRAQPRPVDGPSMPRRIGSAGRARWDMVDERADQSFPASDPPGTY